MKLPSETAMYQALVTRDSSFDGLFIVGVKTTGIFCKPTCPAKKPHAHNVEYFESAHDALYAGYRPCKRCRPMEAGEAGPNWIAPLIDAIEKAPDCKLTDADLRQMGVDPASARRYFQSHFGMTFQGYQRARRLGHALVEIRNGKSAQSAAMDNGFESTSGFREAFQSVFGQPPSRHEEIQCLFARWINTPLGAMLAMADEERLLLLEFVDRRALETEIAWLRKRFKAVIVPGSNAVLEQIERELGAYFFQSGVAQLSELHAASTKTQCTGQRPAPPSEVPLPQPLSQVERGVSVSPVFSTPIALEGTDFQVAVWRQLLAIPSGETRSYSDIARAVNSPKAVRAVGRANGMNRLAIIIPCHRVVRADGALCGYGGGKWRKEWLLDHEGAGQHNEPALWAESR